MGKAVEAADGTWTSGKLSARILPHSISSYHLILYDPHVQVITPVLKALVCLISYVCSLIFLYPCMVNYTPKNIDDFINHWCYIIYSDAHGIFYHINPMLCFCWYLTVHASKSS